jgi:hypothetical protein
MVTTARSVLAFPLIEQDSTPARVPWENMPHGVVSLLDMLEFAAADFVEVSHKLGLVLGEAQKPVASQQRPLDKVGELIDHCARLGLKVTLEHIVKLIGELSAANPGKLTITGSEMNLKDATLPYVRILYFSEVIYSTMRAELASRVFKAIPVEKSLYCDPSWLTNTAIFAKFPETVDEFQKAGRCYAYGENAACIFHLMRVTDFYLRRVADSLHVPYDARNWHGIAEKITKEMEKKYQTKTDEWKLKEPLYAEILTDTQAIGRGHRNPALHELEKKYDEIEARNMLTVIEGFANHVATKL